MILSIGCGILVSWLLLYYELGLGAFLSVLLLLLLFGYNMRTHDLLNRNWWLKAAYIFALSLVFILRDMLIFKVLTFLALPFLFAAFYLSTEGFTIQSLIPTWLVSLFRPLTQIHLLLKHLSDKLLKGRDEAKYITFGILVAAAFMVFILPLLLSSDLVLEAITLDFFAKFELSPGFVFRILFIVVLSSYLYAQGKKKMVSWLPITKKVSDNEPEDPGKHKNVGIMVNTFLIIVNLVYGLFVYVQIRYLFLNVGALPGGITYAEYAREGFFQLLLVAIINVALVAFLEFLNKGQLKRQRMLENCTLAMTFMMAVSAFYRMHLYEMTYGYTSLRMLVFMFLIFLMGLVLLLMAYIFTYKKVVLQGLLAYMMIYYMCSSLFNIESFVASQNIARYEEIGQIHMYYLTSLSEDARVVAEPFIDSHEEVYAEQYVDTYDYRDDYEGRVYQEDWRTQTGWTFEGDTYPWQAWNLQKGRY
jgi:hypothetical protein